jgi:PAS domain S-box-containing protein
LVATHPSGEGWERAFWLVFDRSSNPIALVDDQQRFVDANDATVAILGRTRGEILGVSVLDVTKPSERPRATRDWHALPRSGDLSTTGTIVRPDGSEVEVEFAARTTSVAGRRLAILVVATQPGVLPPINRGTGPERLLTRREREVVTLIALGHETPQMAKEMHISEHTVRTHVRNAMSKLGARTRAQLVAAALCRDDAVHPAHLGE